MEKASLAGPWRMGIVFGEEEKIVELDAKSSKS